MFKMKKKRKVKEMKDRDEIYGRKIIKKKMGRDN